MLFHTLDSGAGQLPGTPPSQQSAYALLSLRTCCLDHEQVQWLINTYEEERTCILPCFETHAISREEWANFVYSLTVADLHAVEDPSHASTLESPL